MKIWIESRFNKREIEKAVKKAGVEISIHRPDFVITYGGDGAILLAEAKYPGVPKITIRKSKTCQRCSASKNMPINEILKRLISGGYKLDRQEKVEAVFGAKRFVGLNEIQVRNRDPRKALRFDVTANGKGIKGVIGDGIVAATPFGSTAYYRSLGLHPFSGGIRMGFNNVYPPMEPIELKGPAKIRIERERALLVCDNGAMVGMEPGDVATIRRSREAAVFVKVV